MKSLLLTILCLSPLVGQVTTTTLFPARDNSLYEDPNGALSNGRGQGIFAGTTFQNLQRRALLAFDPGAQIPAGAKILAVQLQLECTITVVGPIDLTLHRVLASWGEGQSLAPGQGGQGAPATPGDATWLHRSFPSVFWNRPGGDFDPEALAVFSVDQPDFYTVLSNSDLVSDVQSWLDAPSTNNGWLLRADESQFSAKRFGSRESTIPGRAPELRITWTLGDAGELRISPPGCPTNASPRNLRLTANRRPRLGDLDFALGLREATPMLPISLFLATDISGPNPAATLPNGCPFWLEFSSATAFLSLGVSPLEGFASDALGRLQIPLPLVADPALSGFAIALQALEVDASGNLALSNGLGLVLR